MVKREHAFMGNILRADRNGKHNYKSIITLFILILLIAASFSAEIFVIANGLHGCLPDNYPVSKYMCKMLLLDAIIEKINKSIIIMFILSIVSFTAAIVPVKNCFFVANPGIPVINRIRMNN